MLVARRSVHPALLFACCASACSALIHLSVAGDHFAEWVVFGVLFVVSAVLQLVWAALAYLRPGRSVLWAGALLNAGIASVWIWSRTLGLPVGPEAGSPEPVGRLDVVSTIDELLVVAIALWLGLVGRRESPDRVLWVFPLLVINVTVIRAGGAHH